MRLGREERQELVGYLAGEGLSTRAIAPIVAASDFTVRQDIKSGARNLAPVAVSDTRHEFPTADSWTPGGGFVDKTTGEVTEADIATTAPEPAPAPRVVTGIDGKTYTQPAEPRTPRR